MKTAAAYIRVSTDEQIEYSPDSQLKAIRNYAKSHDMILPEKFIFMDEGISGRKADKRPAFQQMIGTAKLNPKPFDVILLWKFSRFARNREDSIVYKSMLRKQCGIDVISISEQLSEDKTSILIEALIEAMDEYYSLNLAEEVKRGMSEKFSRGGVVSQPPFGYKMGDGIFVPDETNAPILQMIFSDYLSGMGARQIASKLNDMGVRSSHGNPFENRTVEYILTNPVYTGKLRRSRNGRDARDRFHQSKDNTLIVDGKHEALISTETFELVQNKIAETKRIYSRNARQAPVEFMLKGLVRCDNCGATLTMMATQRHLQCHRYAKGACNVSHSVALTKINSALIDKLKSDFAENDFIVTVNEIHSGNTNSHSAITAMIEKEKKKLQRIKEAYENGVDSLEEYKENKAKIQSKIDELSRNIREEKPKTKEEINNIISGKIKSSLEVIENQESSETLKNMTLRSFVDRIIFIKPQGVIEIHYKL